jgi:hypothetical protein
MADDMVNMCSTSNLWMAKARALTLFPDSDVQILEHGKAQAKEGLETPLPRGKIALAEAKLEGRDGFEACPETVEGERAQELLFHSLSIRNLRSGDSAGTGLLLTQQWQLPAALREAEVDPEPRAASQGVLFLLSMQYSICLLMVELST